MLAYIDDVADPLLDYIRDDPVRPEIQKESRVGKNRFVMALVDDSITAMICVSLLDHVPATVAELINDTEDANVAVFYTIWSYKPGAGVELLLQTVSEIQQRYPQINRFVTLSPKTALARRFHLKNGAVVYQENTDTVNYEYLVKQH